jgi:SAM-dependent methyltransferase
MSMISCQDEPGWFLAKEQQGRYGDSIAYASVDYHYVRKMIRFLRMSPSDVFYDIGCGEGRILCVASRTNLKRIRGIDISAQLCETAKRNADSCRGKRTEVEVLCDDICNVSIDDGTVYFLFNPFVGETMKLFLEKLKETYVTSPRTIRVVYYNPYFESLFLAQHWLEKYYEFTTISGNRMTFWRTFSRIADEPMLSWE